MNLDFEGEWYGWRLRGRHVVSDDGQRSRRAAEEARRTAGRPKVKVLVIDLVEYRHRGIAAS